MIYIKKDDDGNVIAEQEILNEVQASAFENAGWEPKDKPKRGKQQ